MTKIYGASDDLIEFEGDVAGEVGFYGTDDEDSKGVLLIFSDGTLLTVKYNTNDDGIWKVSLLVKGSLFKEIQPCNDENEDPHSDQAFFNDGLKWAYAATEWEKVS